MHIVVDKMHFKGHVDRWCQQHCNPRDFEELEEVCISPYHYVHVGYGY